MALALIAFGSAPAWADMEAAKAFLDAEIGELSSLPRADQEAEMQWFIDAAKPYAGMEIKVVSETITTHEYEAKVLAPAFEAITGIKVTHDLIGEGDVVEKLQTQMQSGENIYDAYINDSDLIGTADWFDHQQSKDDFKAKYGYDLGVPLNWSAYEDIAEFFTGRDMSYAGGPETGVFGNMDYGKKDPSLGWRYTDAWMSMAGMGDVGEPNGLPVDEWGIRVNENSQPVGSCVARGGATNDAAAVYAVTKAIDWLQRFTPPEAQGMTFGEAGPVPAQGNIAQQMFWYTAFTADMVKEGLPVMNEDGTPKWRMAPSPHGAYWQDGMKVGYQDAGSWTLMKSTPVDRAQAAWLYAQFVVSKTVDVKKSHVGLTFIRESTIQHQSFTDRAPKLGGLVEFYRSPARVQWSPTGTNVPDYPKLAQLWWQNIGDAMSGAKTPQEALDALCEEQEKVLERIERAGVQGDIGPKMNEPQDAQVWLDEPGSPVAKLENEKPQGETIAYDELIKSWQN